MRWHWPLLGLVLATTAATAQAASGPAGVEGGAFHCATLPCTDALLRWEGHGDGLGDDDVFLLPGLEASEGYLDTDVASLTASLSPRGLGLAWSFLRTPLPIAHEGSVDIPASTDDALHEAAIVCSPGACAALLRDGAERLVSMAPNVQLMIPELRPMLLLPGIVGLGGNDLGAPPSVPAGGPALDPPRRGGPGAVPGAAGTALREGPATSIVPSTAAGGSAMGSSAAGLPTTQAVLARLLSDPAVAMVAGVAAGLLLGAALRVLAGDALALPARKRLLDAVRADPGCTVGAVARSTGMSYKTALHHVRVLRRAGLLIVLPAPQPRLFAATGSGALARDATVVLRTPSARKVLERLRQEPARPGVLAAELGLAPSTVAAQIRRLERVGLVRRRPDGMVAA